MKNENCLTRLQQIAESIGLGVSNITFRIVLGEDELILSKDKFSMNIDKTTGNTVAFKGRWRDIDALWTFESLNSALKVKLELSSDNSLDCTSATNLIFDYSPVGSCIDDMMVLIPDEEPRKSSIIRGKQLTEKKIECKLTGLFKDSSSNGLLLATCIPQKNVQKCCVERVSPGKLRFSSVTHFTFGQSKGKKLVTESTWICAGSNVLEAMHKFASTLPTANDGEIMPSVGWNSWDYYFSSVSLDDIIENMETIKKEPILNEKIKYVVVDDGWETAWGEWIENYKFPGGLERLVKEVEDRGFIPGIWVAPMMVSGTTIPALRHPEILVKNKYGDPQILKNGYFLVDPTSPAGRDFLEDIYTRLYKAGIRFYKVDYVPSLLEAYTFYQKDLGPYDAIRELFKIIRKCVTGESYILGCGLPAECGPGFGQSGRIGFDISNSWQRLELVMNHLQFAYIYNGRIWFNDPDFLVVRGCDTSMEDRTNVTDFTANNTDPVFECLKRGTTFNYEEAKTWTNLVSLSGGNIFLSDKLGALNKKGLELVTKIIDPTGIAAVPIDLCDDIRPSFWLQELEREYRLGIVNWEAKDVEKSFKFSNYGLEIPAFVEDLWSGEKLRIDDGKLDVKIKPHGSLILSWRNFNVNS